MMDLVDAWYKKNPWLRLLQPLSGIYRTIVASKTLSYRLGIRKTTHFPVKVIVVGNLTVGGTGKTPLVIALTNYLRQHGYKPGIVSRGYGGVPQAVPLAVTAASDPRQVGDEAVLIARRTGCPLYVSPNRVAAVQALLDKEVCDVVISDDGLQHLALGRDLEIVVVDGERNFGNGFCLPAGPLREPIQRLQSVDFIVIQGATDRVDATLDSQISAGKAQKYAMRLVPGAIYNLKDPLQKLDSSQQLTINALAGIGNPSRFFSVLRRLGFRVNPHIFPDHYAYQPGDINFGLDAPVVMTEKDAVKCEKFAGANHWCLPVEADCGSMMMEVVERLSQATTGVSLT